MGTSSGLSRHALAQASRKPLANATIGRLGSRSLGLPGTIKDPLASRARGILMSRSMTGSGTSCASPTNGVMTVISFARRAPHIVRATSKGDRRARWGRGGTVGANAARGRSMGWKSSGICNQPLSRDRVSSTAADSREMADSEARTQYARSATKSSNSMASARGADAASSWKSRPVTISRLRR